MSEQVQASGEVSVVGLISSLAIGDRVRLLTAVAIRILANFLDLIALAGIGVLALMVAAFSNPDQELRSAAIPLFGDIAINEGLAVVIAASVAFLFLAKSAISITFNRWMGAFVSELELRAGKDLLKKLLANKDLFSGRGVTLPALQNLLVNSLNALYSGMLLATVSAVSEATLLAILLLGFIIVNPIATLALALYLSAVVFALTSFVTRRVRAEARTAYEAAEETLGLLKSVHSVEREVRLNKLDLPWISSIAKSQQTFVQSAVRTTNLSSLPRYLVESSLIIGVFGFLGAVVLFSDIPSQSLTLGVFLTGGLRLIASVLPLQSAWNSIKQNSVTGYRAYEAINLQDPVWRPGMESPVSSMDKLGSADKRPTGIDCRDITFSIGGDVILKDLDFEVEPGQKFAIVGPSGSGKTTLLEVLMGFRKADSGSVSFWIGNHANEFDAEIMRLGYVPQRPHLIAGTISQNITLEPGGVTDTERLFEVVEKSGLATLIDGLPLGAETYIQPDINSLSGGEIQRIGLARALYRAPSVLFLDEATSALDAETETYITQYLDSLRGSITVIVIAHRLSTVRNADSLIYLSQGQLVDQGTFNELLGRQPDFARAAELMDLDLPKADGTS